MKDNRKRSMLEYCKVILSKISFDKRLFRKEYKKTFTYLEPNEHKELKDWVRKELDGQTTVES